MLALQRGASNLYFPEVASSILIPPFSSKVHRVLRDRQVWTLLTSSREDGEVPEDVFRSIAHLRGVDAAQLRAAFDKYDAGALDGEAVDETAYRKAEYHALQGERRDKDDLLACRAHPIDAYRPIVSDYFDRVTLVERLAETRVLTGFSRISPGGQLPGRLSRVGANWLPAFRVHGEGIFLRLKAARLQDFEMNTDSRLTGLVNRARQSGRCPLRLSREMILLHTLAHLLIKRLSYEAGYGASSIRERIYSSTEPGDDRMAGVLLYTAAGDADGTLGGLVGLGQPGRLERVVAGAIEDARWCAADPVCAESPGQGPESLNLAACHACSLIAETSCELQNRFLDRMAVTVFFLEP